MLGSNPGHLRLRMGCQKDALTTWLVFIHLHLAYQKLIWINRPCRLVFPWILFPRKVFRRLRKAEWKQPKKQTDLWKIEGKAKKANLERSTLITVTYFQLYCPLQTPYDVQKLCVKCEVIPFKLVSPEQGHVERSQVTHFTLCFHPSSLPPPTSA